MGRTRTGKIQTRFWDSGQEEIGSGSSAEDEEEETLHMEEGRECRDLVSVTDVRGNGLDDIILLAASAGFGDLNCLF